MSQDAQGQEAQAAALAIAQQRILEIIAQGRDELSLSGLGLVDFPDSLCQQLMKIEHLRSLDLSHNSLHYLPESIGQLRLLQVLSLSENPLSVLPESLGELRQLRVLDISGTEVTALPGGIQGLVEVFSSRSPVYPVSSPLPDSGVRSPKGSWSGNEVTTDAMRRWPSIPPEIKSQINEMPAAQVASQTRNITKDCINASVFSARQVKRNHPFFVQVFAYLPDQIEAVKEAAHMLDETAEQVAKKKLGVQVQRGADLTFELTMREVAVDEPVQSFPWMGWESSVEFEVTVPEGFVVPMTGKKMTGKVTVSQHSVPIGHLKFQVMVVPDEVTIRGEPVLVGEGTRSYKKVFVSYSSKDRAEVLKRVQGINALDMEVFQDVLKLKPGDRWAKKLYLKIDDCDLFLLFWSKAAKDSEWVLKEIRYALALQGGDDLELPVIKPVILEGPPVVPPPKELEDFHFNDPMIYFINQS